MFFLQIQLYRCLHVRGDYSYSKFYMLKICYVAKINRNVNSGLEGQQCRNEIGVGFLINPSLKLSPNEKNVTLIQKRGNIQYTYSNQLTSLETIILYFLGSFAIEAVVPQLCTFNMDVHPPTHVQLKIPTANV